ncbi:MAG: selenide, water dikinase SelD [Fuerstiella sp.]
MKNNSERLASRRVVLLGVGHTNAHVVRMWGMKPIPDTQLTCISDNAIATYSGMLPAVLAGQKSPSDMEIDLVRLCGSVGARLIVDNAVRLDVDQQLIHFADRPPVPFDVLSIGIGSVPSMDGTVVEDGVDGDTLLKIKPMQTFLDRLSAAVTRAVAKAGDRPVRIVIAGSGVAGTEIVCCLPGFLNGKVSAFSLHMVTRSKEILAGTIPSFRQRVLDELRSRNVNVSTGRIIVRATPQGVWLNTGELIEADIVIWATGATSPGLLSELGLPTDDRGFLATEDTLRSTSGQPVFAVGDSGTIVSEKLPKAGVYAVRQGPVLWENIQRLLAGKQLERYRPQRSFLKLLNTGDGSAIGEFKGFSFAGRLVMKLKDHIDGGFMRMYQVNSGMTGDSEAMPCRGCGCKLGGNVLESVLQQAGVAPSSGLKQDALDDAAVIPTSGGSTVIASTDFFSSPFDDHFLAGRVAALHSASDLIAMGATVTAALANVVLPEGDAKSQRFAFSDLMEGARREFAALGATIAGGHTIVGPRLEIGFTVIGEAIAESALLRKGNLQEGDFLYVTKPLGIGVLLAAHMRNACSASHYQSLIAAMLERQHEVARIAVELGLSAATDITGFGLAGHLLEMLKASSADATLDLKKIPLLPGAAVALTSGIESTLAPDNRHVETSIAVDDMYRSYPEYKALFDPQTCGGLLLGVAPSLASEFEQLVSSICRVQQIGVVTRPSDSGILINTT